MFYSVFQALASNAGGGTGLGDGGKRNPESVDYRRVRLRNHWNLAGQDRFAWLGEALMPDRFGQPREKPAMAVRTWILTDLETDQYVDQITIDAHDLDGSADGYRVTKEVLRGGLRDGVESITVDNGTFVFTVLPTRGMSIWKAACDDQLTLGWNSPNRGPVHPRFVPLSEPSGLGWLDGFDELLCRCGLESNGAPEFDDQGRLAYPLHGRIANRPAHYVAVSIDPDVGEINVKGIVEETRFHFAKLRLTTTITTKLRQTGIRIRDEVENISGSDTDMQLLYHVNFGPPLLEPGSRVMAPFKSIVPRNSQAAEVIPSWAQFSAPKAGREETVYFFDLLAGDDHRTHVCLVNATGDSCASLAFDTRQLPCFTLWKNMTSLADGYVTGLEPATNFPNPRSFETKQGRVVSLAPGQRASFDVELAIHLGADEVRRVTNGINELQGTLNPTVFDAPQPNWCA